MTRTGEGADGSWVDDLGLAAALSDAVVVLGPTGAIVWVNDAFCRLVDQDRVELLGVEGLGLVGHSRILQVRSESSRPTSCAV